MGISTGEVISASDFVVMARSSSGTYTGDSTASRAIAHGLAFTPKFVTITNVGGAGYRYRIYDGYTNILYLNHTGTGQSVTVSAFTSTNFFVGTSVNLDISANLSVQVYYWSAMG